VGDALVRGVAQRAAEGEAIEQARTVPERL